MESSASQPRSHALSYESHTLPLAAVRITTCTVMMHLRLCSSTRPGWTPAPRPPTPCPGPHPSARPTPWPDAARCHACVHHAHAHSTMQPGSLPLTTVAPKHPLHVCLTPSGSHTVSVTVTLRYPSNPTHWHTGPHPSARPTPWPDAARCHACVHHAHAHSTMQPGSLPLTTVAPKHPQAPRLCRIPSSFESALKLASIQQVMNAFICLTPRPGPTHLHACMCRNFAYVAATVPCLGTQATSCRRGTKHGAYLGMGSSEGPGWSWRPTGSASGGPGRQSWGPPETPPPPQITMDASYSVHYPLTCLKHNTVVY